MAKTKTKNEKMFWQTISDKKRKQLLWWSVALFNVALILIYEIRIDMIIILAPLSVVPAYIVTYDSGWKRYLNLKITAFAIATGLFCMFVMTKIFPDSCGGELFGICIINAWAVVGYLLTFVSAIYGATYIWALCLKKCRPQIVYGLISIELFWFIWIFINSIN